MSMISLAVMPAAVETQSIDRSFKAIIMFCCLGLLAPRAAVFIALWQNP
jgi:hypothetical protein